MKYVDLVFAPLVASGFVLGASQAELSSGRGLFYGLIVAGTLFCSVAYALGWWRRLKDVRLLDEKAIHVALSSWSGLLMFYVPLQPEALLRLKCAQSEEAKPLISGLFNHYLFGLVVLFLGVLFLLAAYPDVGRQSSASVFGAVLRTAVGSSVFHGVSVLLAGWALSYFLLTRIAAFKGR